MSALSATVNPAVRRLVRRDLAQNKGRTATLFLLTFLPVLFVSWTATWTLTTDTSTNDPFLASWFPSLFMIGLSVATGAIAFAAWGSSIRRRLRTVGLLAASGAEPGHAAAVQGGQAFAISVIGSAAAIGTLLLAGSTTSAVTSLTAPGVSDAAVRWPVAGLVLPALIAVVVATFAGWWPARSTARMPLDALLSGRRVTERTAAGVPVLGTIAVLAGLALLGGSVSRSTSTQMMVMGSLGIIAIALGSLPVLAAVFARLGSERLGSSMPVTLRLVLRDASRHASRSAASVLGIGAIVAAVWLGTVDAVQQQRGPDDQPLLLLIGFIVATVVIGLVTAITASEVRDDLSAMALIGSGPLARARFLGTQAFIVCAVGVGAGLVVGTMIRFAVDDGLPIPWVALLALVGLPFVLGLCVMAVQSVPLAGRRPAVSR